MPKSKKEEDDLQFYLDSAIEMQKKFKELEQSNKLIPPIKVTTVKPTGSIGVYGNNTGPIWNIPIDVPQNYGTPLKKSPLITPPSQLIDKKIIHYTGHSDSYKCLACGMYRDSKAKDVWMVMKKSWLLDDPNFIRCTSKGKWDPRYGKLVFIDAPTFSAPIPDTTTRGHIIELLQTGIPTSPISRFASELLLDLERGAGRTMWENFRILISRKLDIVTTEPGRTILLKILKASYLNS